MLICVGCVYIYMCVLVICGSQRLELWCLNHDPWKYIYFLSLNPELIGIDGQQTQGIYLSLPYPSSTGVIDKSGFYVGPRDPNVDPHAVWQALYPMRHPLNPPD